jgi:organic radical activating enzyme
MKLSRLATGKSEVFRTLQGEGPSLGCPAVFVRLSLCNLHCTWCDTPYTWNWEGTPWTHQDDVKFRKADQIIELSAVELAQQVNELLQDDDRLVLTGGEPLLQQDELRNFLREIPTKTPIEIETNGTKIPDLELDARVAQYNVSPKLANSGNKPELRESPETLRFFARSPKAFFKFVITRSEDLQEVRTIAQVHELPANRILLMPEGRSPEELARSRHWLAEACLTHGYRLTDRLHVQLWGDERGR